MSFPADPTGVSGLTHRSSFADFLETTAPELLPRHRAAQQVTTSGTGIGGQLAPHATTIVAAEYAEGVLIAGDRRATMGNLIAQRDIEKVFGTDTHSAVGIAGTAGLAIELVRLFQVELEHYEKIEGTALTIEGKANRLATMIRGNLGLAMQGLASVPLFVGYDTDVADPARAGRIFSYDVTGGRYPETHYESIGSGSVFAKSSMKKLWRAGLDQAGVVRVAVEALYDAADDDSATGGPDTVRGIYPVVLLVTADGVTRVPDDQLAETVTAVIADRTARPGS